MLISTVQDNEKRELLRILRINKRIDVLICRSRFRRTNCGFITRRSNLIKNRIRYHPFEEIAKSTLENGEDALLTSSETARTIIEVNSKATVMLSSLINNEVQENVIWPELPYVTDEHGNIYFQVKDSEDSVKTLTSENNFVMELSGPSKIDFGIEEIEDEDSDDWVAVLEDEEEDDSDMSLGDWAKLETMRSSHPMYFAKKIAQVTSDDPVDWMEQPPASLAIQGLLRPAFIEEHPIIQKRLSNQQDSNIDINQVGETVVENSEDLDRINGHKFESESSQDSANMADELENDEISTNGTAFYKLEIMKIQLYSAHGHQVYNELNDIFYPIFYSVIGLILPLYGSPIQPCMGRQYSPFLSDKIERICIPTIKQTKQVAYYNWYLI
ncbi:hypothetical protein UlMin_014597 [Ulmus minor]